MIVIVISEEDPVATKVFNILSEKFNETEKSFEGKVVYRYRDTEMIRIGKKHIYADNVDKKYPGDVFIFPSVHKSESGRPSITVHPVGNFGQALLGGLPNTLCPAPAHIMLCCLEKIKQLAPEEFSVSYEVTHHGPFMSKPVFFVEIGSGPEEWEDESALKCIAGALLNLKRGSTDSAIGIGGGHYAPRFTEVALKKRIGFGHMASKYVDLNEMMLSEMVNKTLPKPKYAFIHGEVDEELKSSIERLGLRILK